MAIEQIIGKYITVQNDIGENTVYEIIGVKKVDEILELTVRLATEENITPMKTCPFCGSEHIHFNKESENMFIYCIECKARGPKSDDDKVTTAEKLWNTRINLTAENTWISTDDELPPENTYVLGYYNGDNWDDPDDPEQVYCVVVKFVKGISLAEREAMPDCDRKRQYHNEDQHDNNVLPYSWKTFGPSTFYSQYIKFWKPLEPVPK